MSVDYRVENGVGIVTLNMPEKMNALGDEITEGLEQVLTEIERGSNKGPIVITGAGDRAFSAGGDLAQRSALTTQEKWAQTKRVLAVFRRVEVLEQPVIAAINGHAIGGGLHLALCCDLRIAAENATMSLPEVQIGSVVAGQRLGRIVGKGVAKRLMLTGQRLTAAEAHALGVVEWLVPRGEALNDALKLADELKGKAPEALRLAKKAVDTAYDVDLASGLLFEEVVMQYLIGTQDYQEGLTAAREKRKPNFRGF